MSDDLERKVALKNWKILYVQGVPIEITIKRKKGEAE